MFRKSISGLIVYQDDFCAKIISFFQTHLGERHQALLSIVLVLNEMVLVLDGVIRFESSTSTAQG